MWVQLNILEEETQTLVNTTHTHTRSWLSEGCMFNWPHADWNNTGEICMDDGEMAAAGSQPEQKTMCEKLRQPEPR